MAVQEAAPNSYQPVDKILSPPISGPPSPDDGMNPIDGATVFNSRLKMGGEYPPSVHEFVPELRVGIDNIAKSYLQKGNLPKRDDVTISSADKDARLNKHDLVAVMSFPGEEGDDVFQVSRDFDSLHSRYEDNYNALNRLVQQVSLAKIQGRPVDHRIEDDIGKHRGYLAKILREAADTVVAPYTTFSFFRPGESESKDQSDRSSVQDDSLTPLAIRVRTEGDRRAQSRKTKPKPIKGNGESSNTKRQPIRPSRGQVVLTGVAIGGIIGLPACDVLGIKAASARPYPDNEDPRNDPFPTATAEPTKQPIVVLPSFKEEKADLETSWRTLITDINVNDEYPVSVNNEDRPHLKELVDKLKEAKIEDPLPARYYHTKTKVDNKEAEIAVEPISKNGDQVVVATSVWGLDKAAHVYYAVWTSLNIPGQEVRALLPAKKDVQGNYVRDNSTDLQIMLSRKMPDGSTQIILHDNSQPNSVIIETDPAFPGFDVQTAFENFLGLFAAPAQAAPEAKKATRTAEPTGIPLPTEVPETNTPDPTATAEATATAAPTVLSPENIITGLRGEKDFLQGFTPQEETRIWEALEDLSTHAPQSYTIDNLKADKEFWDFFTKKYNVKEDDIARLLDIGPHFNAFRIRERQFPDTKKKFIYIEKSNRTWWNGQGYMELAPYDLDLRYVKTQDAKTRALGGAAYKEFVAIELVQQANRVLRGKGLAGKVGEIIEVLTLQMEADYLASRLADLPESEQKGIKQRIEDFQRAIKNPSVG